MHMLIHMFICSHICSYVHTGRSANTAHLMENLIACDRIIYGDSDREIALAKEIRDEYLAGTSTSTTMI